MLEMERGLVTYREAGDKAEFGGGLQCKGYDGYLGVTTTGGSWREKGREHKSTAGRMPDQYQIIQIFLSCILTFLTGRTAGSC